MVRLFFLIFVCTVACEEVNISSSECSLPCYDGPPKTYNVGACKAGAPICKDEEFIECSNQVLPTTEMCNGIDDNCNGRADEAVYDAVIGDGCGTDVGECRTGSIQCYEGALTCYADVPPKEETCNGKDDDCNGLVDDLGFSDFCYSGKPETLAHPPCHAGILTCVDGDFECLNERTPSAEICDGVDNNCNGRVDEDLSTKTYDVVLAIDRSCSMLPNSFTEVKQAIVQTTLRFSMDKDVRFALVVFPVDDDNPVPLVISDFVSAEQMTLIAANVQGKSGTGLEPSYDTIRAVVNNTLGLSFIESSVKLLVMWTDEPGQTFTIPLVHEPQLIGMLRDSDLTFVAFVPTLHEGSFDDLADISGGGTHPLTDDLTMSRAVVPYIDTGCAE